MGSEPVASAPTDEYTAAQLVVVVAELRGEVVGTRAELAELRAALAPVLELVETARRIPRLAAQLRKVDG